MGHRCMIKITSLIYQGEALFEHVHIKISNCLISGYFLLEIDWFNMWNFREIITLSFSSVYFCFFIADSNQNMWRRVSISNRKENKNTCSFTSIFLYWFHYGRRYLVLMYNLPICSIFNYFHKSNWACTHLIIN
jgi:hypothetical protein